MNQKEKTCCFTGHRVLPPGMRKKLGSELEIVIRSLVAQGICFFGSGGALDFDTLAAQTVLRLRGEYPQLRLILVLPCRGQTRGWPQESAVIYEALKAGADKIVYTGETYSPGCMQRRNRHLVEHRSVCVAYCTRSTGGSAYTVNYARRQGVRVILPEAKPL